LTPGIKAITCPQGAYIQGKCNTGTQIQSFLFDRNKFSLREAQAWFSKHEHDSFNFDCRGEKAKMDEKIEGVRPVTQDDGDVYCLRSTAETQEKADYWVALCKRDLDHLVETIEAECPICKEIDRIGTVEFAKRLLKSFDAYLLLKAVSDVTEEERKAQEARASKYGISIKKGGNITKPSEYADVPDDEFADPVNYKYPISEKYVKAAWGYYNHLGEQGAGGYTDEEWSKMGKKIEAAMKAYGYEVAAAKKDSTEDVDEVERSNRLLPERVYRF